MSAAQDEIDEETATYEFRKKRGSGTARAAMLAGVLFAIAAGLVYYASQLWTQRESTRAQLRSAKGELNELLKEKTVRGGQLVALEQQHKARAEQLKQNEDKMLELNTALAAAHTRLDELDEERSEIRDQLAEFRQLTQQFRRMIDSGRLEVTFRRGRMIVEMPDKVLFPSGSADLTDEGQKALSEVARILRTMRNRRYIVAGHTDTVPVSTDRFPSNWELSTARAVTVTNALIRGGLRPEQLVAAGYSQYDPVATNGTQAGKQKNRRIEIILEPRLKPLPGLEPAKAAKRPGKTASKGSGKKT
jgi:chemotaxis protein MotB